MENIPNEIQWNIIKFMRHPVAEIFMDAKGDITYIDDDINCRVYVFGFAFNWFNEKMYEKTRRIYDKPIDKEMQKQLIRKIKRTWDVYIRK